LGRVRAPPAGLYTPGRGGTSGPGWWSEPLGMYGAGRDNWLSRPRSSWIWACFSIGMLRGFAPVRPWRFVVGGHRAVGPGRPWSVPAAWPPIVPKEVPPQRVVGCGAPGLDVDDAVGGVRVAASRSSAARDERAPRSACVWGLAPVMPMAPRYSPGRAPLTKPSVPWMYNTTLLGCVVPASDSPSTGLFLPVAFGGRCWPAPGAGGTGTCSGRWEPGRGQRPFQRASVLS